MAKDPVLRSLTLKNFRSVVSERIEFSNPTFLVGPNASGKSNIVNAIKFLSEAISGNLQTVVQHWGGLDQLKHRMPGDSLAIGVELGSIGELVTGARYSFQLRSIDNFSFEIVREQCVLTSLRGDRAFDRQANIVSGIPPGFSVDPTALFLPKLGNDVLWGSVSEALAGARVYDIRPDAIRRSQRLDGGRTLASDGNNVSSVVHQIGKDPARAVSLSDGLGAVLPGFQGIQAMRSTGGIDLHFKQKFGEQTLTFDAAAVSDGTLRMLGLLAAVLQDHQPQVLVIEEPEASIHPALALGMIQDTLLSASEQMQVIVTTHSTDLLDAKWITDENLRMVSWNNGRTRVTPVSNASRMILREQLEYPGSALRSNTLYPPDPLPAPNNLSLFQDVA